MKKSEILKEILDNDGNLIGNDDKPQITPNTETEAGSHTTDHNVGIGHQSFGDDYLGRFGLYFYENEGSEPLRDKIAKETYMYFEGDEDFVSHYNDLPVEIKNKYQSFADIIIALFKGGDKVNLAESVKKIVEDIITTKKDKSFKDKKDEKEFILNKSDKIKTLFKDLPVDEKKKLLNDLK